LVDFAVRSSAPQSPGVHSAASLSASAICAGVIWLGIALGYTTLGRIGFEGRFHYGAIGTVLNLASRLCDEAEAGQILVTQQVNTEIEEIAETAPVGDLALKGFLKPVPAFNVTGLKAGKD